MNNIHLPSKGSRFAVASDLLLLILLLVSLVQIGQCLNAGCLLLRQDSRAPAGYLAPALGTNAPVVGGRLAPGHQSPGFQSDASRG